MRPRVFRLMVADGCKDFQESKKSPSLDSSLEGEATRSLERPLCTSPPTRPDIPQVLILSETLSRNFDIPVAQKQLRNTSLKICNQIQCRSTN